MRDLTYWLRKTPQPKAVLADDKRIEVPNNGRAWKDLTQTIKALEPTKLTCLDAKDQVIRSIVLETEDDSKTTATVTPEMSDLQLFAKLLAEGYEKGMTANQPIIDSAMQFVERQSVRLAKAESEIDRLRNIITKQSIQIADLSAAPAGGDDSIMGAMLAGVAQAQLQQPQPAGEVTPIKQGAKK